MGRRSANRIKDDQSKKSVHAHCLWLFLSDGHQSCAPLCFAGEVFGEVQGWMLSLCALQMAFATSWNSIMQKFFMAGTVFGEFGGWIMLLPVLQMTFHAWHRSTMKVITRGRRNIWCCWKMISAAPRIVSDLSYLRSSNALGKQIRKAFPNQAMVWLERCGCKRGAMDDWGGRFCEMLYKVAVFFSHMFPYWLAP